MEIERRITAPEGCEIEKVKIVNNVAVITFKEKKRKLPKSWEEFCEMFPVPFAFRSKCDPLNNRMITTQANISSVMADFIDDQEISDAIVALIKLIQLRNCYNGDWVPDWTSPEAKFMIYFNDNGNLNSFASSSLSDLLFFKNEELCDEFLRNFRHLIEKLKPLYGIKEGGEE